MIPNPPLLTLKSILETSLPPIEWDCEPIIPHRRRVVVFGEFGALKSWLLLHLGLHLAAGTDWLGFRIPKPRRVLYIDEEMAEEDLRRRIKQLAAGMHRSPSDFPGDLRAYPRVGVTFDQAGAQRLLMHLRREAYNPDVIVVESLVRVLVGNENFAWDVAAFWRHVEPLLRGGATVIISHHMGKSFDDGAHEPKPLRARARGSTEILAGADVGWGVEIVVEGSRSRLSCVKTRASATPRPFMVALTEVTGLLSIALIPPSQQNH